MPYPTNAQPALIHYCLNSILHPKRLGPGSRTPTASCQQSSRSCLTLCPIRYIVTGPIQITYQNPCNDLYDSLAIDIRSSSTFIDYRNVKSSMP
jgi:hypothetical protein